MAVTNASATSSSLQTAVSKLNWTSACAIWLCSYPCWDVGTGLEATRGPFQAKSFHYSMKTSWFFLFNQLTFDPYSKRASIMLKSFFLQINPRKFSLSPTCKKEEYNI